MGTWDESVFGNDTAADWGANLADADDEQVVRATLELAEGGDFLGASDGMKVLAAAEVVAAAGGRPLVANAYSEEVLAWAAARPGLAELAPLAVRAVVRVVGDGSELRELWEEVGASDWVATVQDLLGRLQ
ncbi:DUF4259 domain-containing protein [Kribbella sp. NPDC058245]|uniref:DUF4259 domain-containing protein n=1 Tax=Kribbella sp. NPDC058245 TaxID=3346399 RepID=UPI0036ED9BFE